MFRTVETRHALSLQMFYIKNIAQIDCADKQ